MHALHPSPAPAAESTAAPMSRAAASAALAALARHFDTMPPVAALGARPLAFDGRVLTLSAPLAANVNDKRCAFGGSLSSLMTLAAWSLTALQLEAAGIVGTEIYVADSQVRYLAPVHADLLAEARLADDHHWDDFIATVRQRGRARTTLDARVVLVDGRDAAVFRGRFAAFRPKA